MRPSFRALRLRCIKNHAWVSSGFIKLTTPAMALPTARKQAKKNFATALKKNIVSKIEKWIKSEQSNVNVQVKGGKKAPAAGRTPLSPYFFWLSRDILVLQMKTKV
jgi:hypothetical protein